MNSCEPFQYGISWHAFAVYICHYPGLGPLLGSVLVAVIAVIGAFGAPRIFTNRIKRIEATLEFSRRFQELLKMQHELNREFYFSKSGDRCDHPPVSPKDQENAKALYVRFFDLMLNELKFFSWGLVDRDTFNEWMAWRWYDWEPKRNRRRRSALASAGLETCGVSYRVGWRAWMNRPVIRRNPLVPFLNQVHRARDESEIRRIARWYGPSWFGWRRVRAKLFSRWRLRWFYATHSPKEWRLIKPRKSPSWLTKLRPWL